MYSIVENIKRKYVKFQYKVFVSLQEFQAAVFLVVFLNDQFQRYVILGIYRKPYT
jgi:hypothetical protein